MDKEKIIEILRKHVQVVHKSGQTYSFSLYFDKVAEDISNLVEARVMPNEVLAGGNEELIERVAKYLMAIMFTGANLGIENSSLRNLTEEEYFNLNKDEWKIRAFALIDRIKESQREA